MRLSPVLALAAALLASPALDSAADAADTVPIAAHRALYQLTLDNTPTGDVSAATGTMAYEVTDACDGWATRQRLDMNIVNRDGQEIELISDYATWESKDGLSMRFRMRQTTDTAVTEQTEGSAKLDGPGKGGMIHYAVPEQKDVAMPAGTLLPTQHTEAIIEASMAGKHFLTVPLFDGTGDRGAQDSFVVMSKWGDIPKSKFAPLASQPGGRFHVSFFDRDPKPNKDKPTGTPDYEVSMIYYLNGVADDLRMNFGDFIMHGTISDFHLMPSHC